jgi:hypothetical protein
MEPPLPADQRVKLQNHWATPLKYTLQSKPSLGPPKKDLLALLNYYPPHQQYWSVHERDQLFGAKWDTYRYQWTGSSVHNPEYEDEALNKNMASCYLCCHGY